MKLARKVMALAGAVMLLMAISSIWQSANAAGTVNFGSYTITSTAPGFEMWEDEPSANAHPEGGGQAPYSASIVSSGGLGYALSSVAWPGATEANLDKVALLLLGPQVEGSGAPDPVVQAFNTAVPLTSYPIRAEARTGDPSPDSSFNAQAAKLNAHADPVLAQATATMSGAEGQPNFGFGNAETIASSVLDTSTGKATADSRISNIDIGGVIKIESVTSNATASTDGATTTASGLTVVQGMTIAGQKAYVDDQGVHIGEQGQPANAIVNQIVNKALVQGGFTFYVSQPQVEQSGPTASYTAGSLFIQWKPPQNDSENVFLIALGGSRVSVTAVPGTNFRLPTTPTIKSVTPPSSASAVSSSPSRPGISSTPATSAAPAAPKPATAPAVNTSPIAATFGGLAGQAVLGLLGAGLMYFGIKRAATEIVDRPPSTCPLETT